MAPSQSDLLSIQVGLWVAAVAACEDMFVCACECVCVRGCVCVMHVFKLTNG